MRHTTSPAPRLLIQEPPLQVLPSLAIAIGLHEAIVLQQLYYLLRDPNFGRKIAEHKWIFNTFEEWQCRYFPFWSVRTIKTIFANLASMNLVVSCQPEGGLSRRKYYRINEDELDAVSHRAKIVPWIVQNSSLPIIAKTTTKTTYTGFLTKTQPVDFESCGFTEKERGVIQLYHNICVKCGMGFYPVTERTDELAKALELFQDTPIQDMRLQFERAVEDRRNGSENRSIIRILWANY
jgi:hypothetical protein